MCRKSFCVIGAILSHCFQKTRCIFRGRRSTLETSIVILRGRRSTLDESCCVFFVNRIVKTASSGGNVQIHGRRCILWDVMKINGCLARNIHFEVVDFGVRWALAGERRFCGYKVRGGLAQNARFEAPTCLVSILWFSCGVSVPMLEAAKPFIFEGFNTGSHVVLRGKSGI